MGLGGYLQDYSLVSLVGYLRDYRVGGLPTGRLQVDFLESDLRSDQTGGHLLPWWFPKQRGTSNRVLYISS